MSDQCSAAGAGDRTSPRRRSRVTRVSTAVVAALATMCTTAAPPATATTTADDVVVQTLHFKVKVGPEQRVCDIVGDLYTPASASGTEPLPAILTTHGFGDSKDDMAGIGDAFARRGYVVLAYSGLGFGGSDCKVTLDTREYDGVAGSQLISYLGGADGIAYVDDAHTEPLPPLDIVQLDDIAHDGSSHPHDPRVGMVGGSYGGQIQFAVAAVDPRLDTIVPFVTWNDLAYSLGPNNADVTTGVSTATPGVFKLTWGAGFVALGLIDALNNAATDPARLLPPCPAFAPWVCPTLVTAATLGHFMPDGLAHLRNASVATYLDKIRIPTLLIQGQKDTLFNLNEAAATYEALEAQGTEVKMIWQSWGHSIATPQEGEIDLDALDPAAQYEAGRVADWFDHHLKGAAVGTGPEFAYYREWVDYTGNAAPAYGVASQFPVGTESVFHLSGQSLVPEGAALARGKQSLLTAVAGAPANLTPLETISVFANVPVPEADLPGTTAHWDTAALPDALDVVGAPKLKLEVSAPASALTQGAGPSGKLVLFVRLQDVAPDGTATDIDQLTAPIRVPDVSEPMTVTLPAIVHRFAAGHRIRMVVSGSSLNYRSGLLPNAVTIRTGSAEQALTLPTVP